MKRREYKHCNFKSNIHHRPPYLHHRSPTDRSRLLRKTPRAFTSLAVFMLNFIAFAIFCFSTLTCGYGGDSNVLIVGKELFRQILPLQSGSRYYELQGLKPLTWYEVKISYPASIPAVFSLQLMKGKSDVGMNKLRKLLNTEKLIFKAENLDEINRQGGLYVLVTVEPEGYVALPGVQERESILFNIVCDELVLGLPHKVWLVAALAVLCVVVGFIIPRFLPPSLLGDDQEDKVQTDSHNKDT